MGGNALKHAVTRRYKWDEYQELCAQVNQILNNVFPDCRHEVIKAYRNKLTFGDMDVVIESDNLPTNWQEELIDYLLLLKTDWFIEKNSNCFSFAYRQFQIDLIVTPSAEYQTSLNYFAYNDLGNLCGRIANMMGLKLGHDGLAYIWRAGETYHFKTIVIEKDWNKILPVLGLDPERYNEGFDTLHDIFTYVVSSPFFHHDIFLLHNRNHTSRVRDAKRKTYMEFLQWLETFEPKSEQRIWQNWHRSHYEETGNKTHWLPHLFANLENFEPLYKEVQAEWEMEEEFRRRYNGDLVREWLNIDGKDLGEFMKYIRTQCGQHFKTDVVKMNPTLVKGYVLYFYDKFNGRLPVINFDAEAFKPHRVKGK